jgi:hypothetical protein
LHQSLQSKLQGFWPIFTSSVDPSGKESGDHVTEMQNGKHLQNRFVTASVLISIMLVQEEEALLSVVPNCLLYQVCREAFQIEQRAQQLND